MTRGTLCGMHLLAKDEKALRKATKSLADLIEPEPDITCHMAEVYVPGEHGAALKGFYCDACGCGNDEKTRPEYRPHCRARVINDGA